jgi:5'-nucleotidase
MPTILVTNDDGVHAQGLLPLKQALGEIGDVVVLAPDSNWSATSHMITMHKPLRVHDVTLADGSAARSCSGSPTDCVALAAGGVLDVMPDLVVSGINAGHNLGIDVTYSGTVACAMEAAIHGIPGIAVSTVAPNEAKVDLDKILEKSAQVACHMAKQVLERGLPYHTLLNINVPGIDPAEMNGMHVTRLGGRHYESSELIARHDPWGRPYYWLGGGKRVDAADDGSDVGAILNGHISLTPITLDMTAYKYINALQGWDLPA